MDWSVISNDETARQFGDRIMEAPRAFARSNTSISAGIHFGMTLLDRAPYKAHRRVIDASGDGDKNTGRDPAATREGATSEGIPDHHVFSLHALPYHAVTSRTHHHTR